MVYDRNTHPSVYRPYSVKPTCLHITHGCFLTTMVELSSTTKPKILDTWLFLQNVSTPLV